jgi:hypothetical protein
MGTQLGVSTKVSAESASMQELPSSVVQEADTYSTVKKISFRHLAAMTMGLRNETAGAVAERAGESSNLDMMKSSSVRNKEFLSMLLESDADAEADESSGSGDH